MCQWCILRFIVTKKPNGFIINHLAFNSVTPVGLEPTTH